MGNLDARLSRLELLAGDAPDDERAAFLARLTPNTDGAELDRLLARLSQGERDAFVAECGRVLIRQSIEAVNDERI